MDTFVDKLVERINSQGSVRTQNMPAGNNGSRVSEKRQAEIMQHLADMEDKLAKNFTENVTEAVKESNACCVEMLTEYKQESHLDREKIAEEIKEHVHSESVKCYRNTQAAVEEIVARNSKEMIDSLVGVSTNIGGKTRGVQGLLVVIMVLLMMNLAGLAVVLLSLFHVIG